MVTCSPYPVAALAPTRAIELAVATSVDWFHAAPRMAPAAPPSDCISTTWGTVPHKLGVLEAAQASENSPMGVEGVIGYIAITSLNL